VTAALSTVWAIQSCHKHRMTSSVALITRSSSLSGLITSISLLQSARHFFIQDLVPELLCRLRFTAAAAAAASPVAFAPPERRTPAATVGSSLAAATAAAAAATGSGAVVAITTTTTTTAAAAAAAAAA